MLIGLPCTVGMYIYAQPILDLLFPNASAGAVILEICSLTILFTILDQTINGALQGYGKLIIPTVSLACRRTSKAGIKPSTCTKSSNWSKWRSVGICCLSCGCIYNCNYSINKAHKNTYKFSKICC